MLFSLFITFKEWQTWIASTSPEESSLLWIVIIKKNYPIYFIWKKKGENKFTPGNIKERANRGLKELKGVYCQLWRHKIIIKILGLFSSYLLLKRYSQWWSSSLYFPSLVFEDLTGKVYISHGRILPLWKYYDKFEWMFTSTSLCLII